MYADLSRIVLEMHGDLAGRLDELKAIMLSNVREATDSLENQSPALPEVPDYLAERFQTIASQSKPTNPLPLVDCIDAVAYHFENSTRKFRENPPLLMKPDPGEYLNLMKCLWILHQIKSHPNFRNLCQDILWKAYVRELERNVLKETRRFAAEENPLREPASEDTLREPPANFSIWVELGEIDDFPTLAQPSGLEVKVFEASLPEISRSREQALIVFRLNEHRIRIVRIVTSATDKEREGHEIDTKQVTLLPLYAFPNRPNALPSVSWRATASDQRTQALTFTHLGDVYRMQEAITNFGVVFDMSGVTDVRVKESSFGKLKSIGSNARAQVWVYRPPETFEKQSSTSDAASAPSGRISAMSGSSVSRGEWAKSYIASTSPSSSIQQSGGRALLRKPVPSQLVLFAMRQVNRRESLRFISIPIDQETRLSPENCHCSQPKKQCVRIVIKRKNGVHVKVLDNKGQEHQWNLAALGYPEHSEADHNLELLKGMSFLTIDFETVQKRIAFAESFEAACLEMRDKVHSYWAAKGSVRNLEVAT
jgi:hypothetical protein